jgi:hypothetical protein
VRERERKRKRKRERGKKRKTQYKDKQRKVISSYSELFVIFSVLVTMLGAKSTQK